MAIRKLFPGVSCFLLGVVVIGATGRSDQPHPESQQFSVAKHGRRIYLPVRVSGCDDHSLPFLFATGSDRHIVDAGLLLVARNLRDGSGKSTLGSQRHVISIYNDGRTPEQGLVLSVGNVFLRGPNQIHVLDLSAYREAAGREFRGIIGAPFLRGRLVQIDFDQGIVRIDPQRPVKGQNWESLPLITDPYGMPWVTGIRVGARTESFLLNTSYDGSVQLHRWLFDSLVRSGHLQITGVAHVTTTVGRRILRQGKLAKLTWGPFWHRDLVATEGEANYLGMSYLSRFMVTLDLADRHIYLRKGKHYDKQDVMNDTGIQILKIDGKVVISSVDNGSPAERTGVLKNDKMITINGRGVSRMSLDDIRCLLREAHGKRVTLSLKRKGSVVKVSFVVPVDSTLAKESGKKEKKPGPRGTVGKE